MFTVKHINRDTNSERVFEAESVHRDGGVITILTTDDDGEVLGVDAAGNEIEGRTELVETVYVMNRFGATVATYHF